MRVSRVQAAENRNAVINVASRLFRKRGFDGIGLKDLMKGAGLTQGAFYKQFASKDDLAAQASMRTFESAKDQWSAAAAADPDDPFAAVVAMYLSTEHCAAQMDGCPIAALGPDAVRQGGEVKAAFEAGIKAHLETVSRLTCESAGKPGSRGVAILSTLVGAVILARIVDDARLSKRILQAAADSVMGLSASGKRARK